MRQKYGQNETFNTLSRGSAHPTEQVHLGEQTRPLYLVSPPVPHWRSTMGSPVSSHIALALLSPMGPFKQLGCRLPSCLHLPCLTEAGTSGVSTRMLATVHSSLFLYPLPSPLHLFAPGTFSKFHQKLTMREMDHRGPSPTNSPLFFLY